MTPSSEFPEGFPLDALLVDVKTKEYLADQKIDSVYANLIRLLSTEVKDRILKQ